jgi:hypothetical protein
MLTIVIPAKAGIHASGQEPHLRPLDSRFRGNDAVGNNSQQ